MKENGKSGNDVGFLERTLSKLSHLGLIDGYERYYAKTIGMLSRDAEELIQLAYRFIKHWTNWNFAAKVFAESRKISVRDFEQLCRRLTQRDADGFWSAIEAMKKSAEENLVITEETSFSDLIDMARLTRFEKPLERPYREQEITQAMMRDRFKLGA